MTLVLSYGFRDYRLHLHAARCGMRVAYWSVCPWDWEQYGIEKTVEQVMGQMDPCGGDIIAFTETDGHFTSPNYSLPAAVDKVCISIYYLCCSCSYID